MTTDFLKFCLVAGLLGIAACGPTTPAPDYTIRVIPATGTQAAQTIPPACPKWSDNDLNFFDNQPLPQFGCADARNLALMVDNPEDLLQGRNPGPANGVTTAGTIIRYNNNQARGLIDLGSQADTTAAATTAPTSNSKMTGETSESSSGSSSGN
jgi:pilus assembly protein CpaD